MLRQITTLLLIITLSLSTLACGSSNNTSQVNSNQNVPKKTVSQKPLTDGKYPVQQASYNDVDGEYTLMLLNTPPGVSATYKTTNLQMARLKEEEIKAGENSYLKVENNQPALYLTSEFKIEYVHNVTETRNNPQTGQKEVIVVKQESNFWTPFLGSLAGNVVANTLFTPQYYVPPVYQPGVVMTGYGGYGRTYDQAITSYSERYQTPPPVVRNRTVLRTTGNINSSNSSFGSSNKSNQNTNTNTNRATGSGFGSSNLKSSGNSSDTKRSPSFGSGGVGRRTGGFGSKKR
ncbi:MAG TPA: hypothetical protein V6C58_22115 [Allocoleopsis sp.]